YDDCVCAGLNSASAPAMRSSPQKLTMISPEVERGAVLKALWEHRRDPLTKFDEALKHLPIPFDTKKGILKFLESGGLVQCEFEPLSENLGNGRITFYGVQVVEGYKDPPPFIFHQHIQTGSVSVEETNFGGGLNIATDQGQASQVEKKSMDWIERINTAGNWAKALFGRGQ